MTPSFLDLLNQKQTLVADGATGTNLQMRGLPVGKSGEYFVLENPDAISGLVSDFVQAGADIVLTCTFGASRVHLKTLELEEHTEEINQRAVLLSRKGTAGSPVLVAGSIGPTGEMLQPYGTLSAEAAEETFAEQARLLAEAGVDLLVVETMFDLGEATAAVKGARSVCNLPLVCSFSYDRGTKTMMGLSPTKAAKAVEELEVDLIGINCGRSLDDNLAALKELQAATGLPIWFKPNAGLPGIDDMGNPYYELTPAGMAEPVPEWIARGARVIGGCCGTSPEHLKAIAEAVKGGK